MVSYFMDQESVGLYGFALRVAEIPTSFAAVFAGVFYARALNFSKVDFTDVNALSRVTY